MKKQTGFTVIELLIILAIVGILIAIIGPAYNDYRYRSENPNWKTEHLEREQN